MYSYMDFVLITKKLSNSKCVVRPNHLPESSTQTTKSYAKFSA